MLLPLHQPVPTAPSNAKPGATANKLMSSRMKNVWDEREELFGIGDSDDDEPPAGSGSSGRREQPIGPAPKVIVTQASA